MQKQHFKWLISAIVFSLLLGLARFAYITNYGHTLFNSFDYIFYDFKQNIFLDQNLREEQITVVEIDESTLIEHGRWPWSRKKTAELIEYLFKAGADKVVLDIIFSELSDDEIDMQLAKVIEKHKDKVVLGSYVNYFAMTNSAEEKKCLQDFIFTKKNKKTTETWSKLTNYESRHSINFDRLYSEISSQYLAEKNKKSLFDLNDSELFYLNNKHAELAGDYCKKNSLDSKSSFYKKYTPINIILNIDILQDAASATGVFSVIPDRDGSIRKYYTRYFISDLSIPSSASVPYQDEDLPTQFWINYTAKMPLKISAAEFFKPKKPDLDKQLVFLGVTSPGVYDIRKTPINEALPGTYILAQAASNLKNKNYLSYWNPSHIFFVMFSISMLFLLALNNKLTWIKSSSFFLILLCAILILEYILFLNNNIFWSFDFYLLWGMLFVTNNIFYYRQEMKQKNYVKSIFSKYVSENVVDEVLNSPEKVNLAGEKKLITVFFSDIRNFTSLSENLDPLIISRFLNLYFDPMVETIKKNNGTVDKFIGDGLMAFYGAPIENSNNASHACRSALQCVDNLKIINLQVSKDIQNEINIGIGINQQEVFVGNIGSNNLQSYTVIGDGVNLAARLQNLTKRYNVKIIVSESVYQKCQNEFTFRKLDLVKVKGRLKQIWIYELCIDNTEEASEYRSRYTKLLDSFFSNNIEKSRENIRHILQIYPNDAPTLIIQSRLVEIEKNPVSNWEIFKYGTY